MRTNTNNYTLKRNYQFPEWVWFHVAWDYVPSIESTRVYKHVYVLFLLLLNSWSYIRATHSAHNVWGFFVQESQDPNSNPVRTEEAKLKAKYPNLGQKPGGSDFLMKRLQKGVGGCMVLNI